MGTTFAAGYIRVSTDVQVKSGESLNIQRQAIQAQAQRLGIRLRKVYQDAGVSGRTAADRHDLQESTSSAPCAVASGATTPVGN
jgi:DNA invertase Pin-like site-specific DNA recombinase